MSRSYFAPFGKQKSIFDAPSSGNCGPYPLAAKLILPDERTFRFALAGSSARVAGKIYQGIAPVANHNETVVSTVPAAGDKTIASTLGATAAAIDIYSEGTAHFNKSTGLNYGHRIRRAISAGQAHAAADASAVITVTLEPGETVDVAGDSSTEVSYSRNRYHATVIHPTTAAGITSGASVGIAGASKYYYEQTRGECALTCTGTLVIGDSCVASASTAGNVMPSAAIETDGPALGMVMKVNVATETALVFLQLD